MTTSRRSGRRSHWRAGLLLAAAAMAGCGGSDDAAPGDDVQIELPSGEPRSSPYGFHSDRDFLADATRVANPGDSVILALWSSDAPASQRGRAAAGVAVVPYDHPSAGPRTYCWNGAAPAAGQGAPHSFALRDLATKKDVLRIEEGGPCVTATIPAGHYAAVLRRGAGRSGTRDLVSLTPPPVARGSARARTMAAAPLAAAPALACPKVPYHYPPPPGQSVFTNSIMQSVQLVGACGDLAVAPVPLLPNTIFQLLGIAPNTVVRVYSETGFRGTRSQYGKAGSTAVLTVGKFLDYNGMPNYPRARSAVNEIGTPSTSTTTLISTNSCNGCNFQGANLSGLDLAGASLNDADFSHAELSKANLGKAQAARALFASADLAGTNLSGAVLTQASFQSDGALPDGSGAYPAAELNGADLSGTRLDNAVLTGVTAVSTLFANAVIDGADFSGADLTRAVFDSATAAELTPAVFNGATLTYASLKHASLPGAFFRGTLMNPSNLGDAELSGAWFEADGSYRAATLAGSYMRDARLAGAHMTSVSLDRVSWFNTNPALVIATGAGAFLTGASFNTADLPGLDLTGAYLQGATMTSVQLTGANLTDARLGPASGAGTTCPQSVTTLSSAFLIGSNLIGTDLSCANLENALVSRSASQAIYIQVLADPGHYEQPNQSYQYFAVDQPPTSVGTATTVSVITDGARCPNGGFGTAGSCGPLSSANWTATKAPDQPTNCTPAQVDPEGNVISLDCQSTRH